MTKSDLVRELRQRIVPTTLANDRLLPVPGALAPLFPFGGLQRGRSVGFEGQGGWSVALALAGTVLGTGGWVASVGLEELGLLAAAELGVPLDRVLVVETVAPSLAATTIATLLDAVDVILVSGRVAPPPRDARRIAARARERGTVLFHLDGPGSWPEPVDLTLSTGPGVWDGIGRGHGHLRSRRLEIEASGRRSRAGTHRVSVLLPAPDGRLAPAPDAPAGIGRHDGGRRLARVG